MKMIEIKENYERILKGIEFLREELEKNIIHEDFPILFSREELINMQIAIVKSLVFFMK